MTELQEIKEYWNKKYPAVTVALWNGGTGKKYFGKMSSCNDSIHLQASTLGELISQGESFLRKVIQ